MATCPQRAEQLRGICNKTPDSVYSISDYIETYKAILDRLSGMKISISDGFISFGNACFFIYYQLQSVSVSIYLTPIS